VYNGDNLENLPSMTSHVTSLVTMN